MPPTVEDRLRDILEAIEDIERLLKGIDIQKFNADRILRLASERLLEIVCEASRMLPDSVKKTEPGIDWRKLIDFGNVLRHAYHATDTDKVWDVIQNHLPPLKSFVERRIRTSGR
jgi:uncharacterized protein with HEPN domain